ncbi:FAD-binding oxidoreductase [Paenibacillus polymyxa]|uniref:FAD/FMN-containing dehydrogenase n=1 Tax=Paenibacillus polymyxa TaxID=1406 RepID=A0A378Y836_PAEPO|nr:MULTISPECIES: FAD-binding oxidoreductase [Paenibacillus]MBE7899414.1 FAD-binding oxidoreductase [Paenibacillus polymyxa]MBG9762428.1 dehydrogenase [Paenibacillus polymyxa]MCC3258596.1 FAD-binding oxidoreductase [Paenibacillus polymyxa]QPK52759.1 FAD-binding oxidoreductase [Paenibacillus polymyxa]QPK57837.1 FAD-binding oxidoreductase [Paenibacillus polymyxa]
MAQKLQKKSTRLTGRIVIPGNPSYNMARMEFNRRFSKFPRVIVFCQRTQDVINAVKWARERGIRLRVRSGRHSYEGFSTVNGGIIIDVSEMNKVTVDRKNGVAIVQTGNPLARVYKKLWNKRVAIPAGTAPDVGVAGLTLGGGIGLLSRKYGLTCDNLKQVKMVVASGRYGAKTIVANSKKHSDLLWASRGGGGGNFGVATEFTFRIRPISKVSIYSITWKWSDLEKVLPAWQRWAPSVTNRLTSTIEVAAKQVGSIVSTGQLLGGAEELRRLIRPLLRAGTPVKVMVKTVPFIEATHFFAESDLNLEPKFKITGAYGFQPLPPEGVRIIRDFLAQAPNRHSSVWSQSLGGARSAVSRVSPTATAYPHRKAETIYELSARWRNSGEQERNIQWVERFRKALRPFVKGNYVNFPDLQIKNWPKAYYGVNFGRLKQVKRKYDPHNVFHFAQSIPVGKQDRK